MAEYDDDVKNGIVKGSLNHFIYVNVQVGDSQTKVFLIRPPGKF